MTPTEERKVVSVLFCDQVGFTAAAESADPEDVRGWLAPYHEVLRSTVESFGGTMEKFAGDAILAVFGAPRSHEDDPERAVRAGLAILDALAGQDQPLQVRIGINTGEALVALDARPEAGEAFVTGNVVNTAARLQTSAPVGAVVVGEGTHRATARVFGYEPLEPVTAKGLSAPLQRWRAGAPRARLGVDLIRNLTTPLVGRVRDLTLLSTAFEKAVADRTVQFVTLVGEPGIGKSRLVAELAAQLDRRDELITWREGRCLPYGEGPFWPLAEIFKAQAGILDTDRPDEAEGKLEAILPESADRAWLKARVRPLLGLGARESTSQEESFTAWRQVLESFAETGPAVIVLEDLHWAEDGLLAFVEYLADWASGLPLLVVATARPELLERHPQWLGGLQNALSIGLSRLSDAETGELLSVLEVPEQTRAVLLKRTGGNPLYAEEMVRMLRDSEALRPDGTLRPGARLDLPEGVAALIAARLDTLAPDRKAMLADAAVVGRVFWAEAVAEMGGRDPEDVVGALHELVRKELVRPVRQSTMAGQREYEFWHVMVRDVAYGQLPRGPRGRRHRAAADWIERQCERRLADAADVLAYHLGTAMDLARATGDAAAAEALAPRARWFARVAAERAMNLDAAQALGLLDRVLALTPDDDPARPGVLHEWGWAAYQAGEIERAQQAFLAAVDGFEARGDVAGTARALRSSTYAMTNMAETMATIEQVVALLEPLDRPADLVEALAGYSALLGIAGRQTEAVDAADRALRLAAEHELPVPQRALEFRGFARVSIGDSGGLADIKSALAAMLAAGGGRDAGITWANYAITVWLAEGPVAALATLREVREFAARRGFRELDQMMRCTELQPRIETGDLRGVVDSARAEIAADDPAFVELRRIEVMAALARALLELDDESAAGCAEEAYAIAVAAGWPDFIAIAGAPMALARARAADRDGVREVLDRLIRTPELPDSLEFAPRLPAIVRAAVEVGETDAAAVLTGRVQPLLAAREYATTTSRALLAEAHGELAAAAFAFATAAAGWAAFGNRLEQAYALLGLSRSTATSDPARSATAHTEARTLLSSMSTPPS